ncbi:hypothetical protein AAE478_001647 [Parahypoxylon ruwenzoriense]
MDRDPARRYDSYDQQEEYQQRRYYGQVEAPYEYTQWERRPNNPAPTRNVLGSATNSDGYTTTCQPLSLLGSTDPRRQGTHPGALVPRVLPLPLPTTGRNESRLMTYHPDGRRGSFFPRFQPSSPFTTGRGSSSRGPRNYEASPHTGSTLGLQLPRVHSTRSPNLVALRSPRVDEIQLMPRESRTPIDRRDRGEHARESTLETYRYSISWGTVPTYSRLRATSSSTYETADVQPEMNNVREEHSPSYTSSWSSPYSSGIVAGSDSSGGSGPDNGAMNAGRSGLQEAGVAKEDRNIAAVEDTTQQVGGQPNGWGEDRVYLSPVYRVPSPNYDCEDESEGRRDTISMRPSTGQRTPLPSMHNQREAGGSEVRNIPPRQQECPPININEGVPEQRVSRSPSYYPTLTGSSPIPTPCPPALRPQHQGRYHLIERALADSPGSLVVIVEGNCHMTLSNAPGEGPQLFDGTGASVNGYPQKKGSRGPIVVVKGDLHVRMAQTQTQPQPQKRKRDEVDDDGYDKNDDDNGNDEESREGEDGGRGRPATRRRLLDTVESPAE